MIEWLESVDWTIWYHWMFTIDGWVSLVTLTFLEIILGIDNLVFLTIASQNLPPQQRARAQRLGLSGALVLRVAMLATLVWLTKLKAGIVTVYGFTLSYSDVIFMVGGLFLLYKATGEIHQEVEGEEHKKTGAKRTSFFGVISLIMVIDFVFALDSIITAVGLSKFLPVMIAANVAAILVMLLAARPVGQFIERHPTVKMLALAFILLVGVMLIADGLHIHIPRGFLYFAIAFSLAVEALNIAVRTRRDKRAAKPAVAAKPKRKPAAP
jgi:predicted tellurium resistance membrane protein TerC